MIVMRDSVVELVVANSGTLTPTHVVDYIAVEQYGYTQSEWAQCRGVSQQAVSQSVTTARSVIEQ